jgi:selenocysteine-specific elongation factor
LRRAYAHPSFDHVIVATAGHVDHGKTTLIRALTGVDTDRLPEEKARGMSIDIGFAYRRLGAETDAPMIGFVDVPGHERFVGNMLAGVTAIDAALLVVAADDGLMPQTREHLAILDLLGLDRGLVALNKVDRVDAARAAEVTRAIRELLASTRLAGAEVMPVSAMTGVGVDALRERLDLLARESGARGTGGNFRLAVDRCFTVAGAGLVVTGAAFAGEVKVGDELVLSPAGIAVRVRGLHVENAPAELGHAGQRMAVNLAGSALGRAEVKRGDWLVAASAHGPTQRFDARLRLAASETRPLAHWTPAHLHLGALDVTCRVAVLEGERIAPGDEALVQIIADRPLGAWSGDRLVLRDQTAQRTLGGGSVLDPQPPARRKRAEARLKQLGAWGARDAATALTGLLDTSPAGVNLASFARARNLTPSEAEALMAQVPMVRLGDNAVRRADWEAMQARILDALATLQAQRPDRLGPTEGEVRQVVVGAGAAPLFVPALQGLIEARQVHRRGPVLHTPGHQAQPTRSEANLWKRVEPLIVEGGLRPPRVREIAHALDLDLKVLESFLARSVELGWLFRVADNRYFPPAALAELAAMVEDLVADGEGFNAAQYRDRSGVGRNVAIELLEFFDRIGFTRRTGELRRPLKPAKGLFTAE